MFGGVFGWVAGVSIVRGNYEVMRVDVLMVVSSSAERKAYDYPSRVRVRHNIFLPFFGV